jgi:hypothetical protein
MTNIDKDCAGCQAPFGACIEEDCDCFRCPERYRCTSDDDCKRSVWRTPIEIKGDFRPLRGMEIDDFRRYLYSRAACEARKPSDIRRHMPGIPGWE